MKKMSDTIPIARKIKIWIGILSPSRSAHIAKKAPIEKLKNMKLLVIKSIAIPTIITANHNVNMLFVFIPLSLLKF